VAIKNDTKGVDFKKVHPFSLRSKFKNAINAKAKTSDAENTDDPLNLYTLS